MSSDNFYVVRKHPEGGYTYITGFASFDINKDGSFKYDLPVNNNNVKYKTFDDALNAALEDYSEYGVFTHPECEDNQLRIKGWEGTD
jgi:hypothetical protein